MPLSTEPPTVALAPVRAPALPLEPLAMAAYVGVGANLGDARAHLLSAHEALSRLPHTQLAAQSSLYRSAPVDSWGPDYLNTVVLLHTCLAPQALLDEMQRIELAHGRERPYRNAPRTLDLDLLVYGERVVHTDTLTVPHPRMGQRAFVLWPLAEIAPQLVVPGSGPIGALLHGVAGQRIERLAA